MIGQEVTCENCGQYIKPDAKFCGHCGVSLTDEKTLTRQIGGGFKTIGEKGKGTIDKLRESERKHREQQRIEGEARKQALMQAEMQRIHVATFNSQKEYDAWLKRAGPTIEIVDTAASSRHGLIYSGIRHKTTFTITYKIRQPQPPSPSQHSQQSQPQQQIVSMDIPGQIMKLAELKGQGILTEAEFQAKKQELLSKM